MWQLAIDGVQGIAGDVGVVVMALVACLIVMTGASFILRVMGITKQEDREEESEDNDGLHL